MAAQAGIWYFDSQPVTDGVVGRLSGLNVLLGPDGFGIYRDTGIALLSFALHFDALAKTERQPIRLSAESILTWDGRLDNRDDFIIRLRPRTTDGCTDAALLADALTSWGDEALARAEGDWALAFWDLRTRRLTLARDYCGNRPLFYYCGTKFAAWSTALEPLSEVCGVADTVDDTYLTGLLTFNEPVNFTCHPNIFAVPPGHSVELVAGSPPILRAYSQMNVARIHYSTSAQYEEHFRAELVNAVKTRLRANRPVWMELSGGYDSSTVTCVAATLVRSASVSAPSIQPVSVVQPGSPESSELRYIEAVEQVTGVTSIKGDFRRFPDLEASDYELFPFCGHSYVPSPAALASQAGAHVLLTGQFGDAITSFGRDLLLHSLKRAQLRKFFRDCVTRCRATRQNFATVVWEAVSLEIASWRRMPRTVTVMHSELAKLRHLSSWDPTQVMGLSPDHARRVVPAESIFSELVDDSGKMNGLFLQMLRASIWTGRVSAGHFAPLRISHPFTHRPLVELVLAIPHDQLWSPAHPRAFAIRALRDILPADVLKRGNKGYLDPGISRDVRPIAVSAMAEIDRWLLVQRGYLQPTILRTIFARFLDGSQNSDIIVRQLLLSESLLQRINLRTRQGARPLVQAAGHDGPRHGALTAS